MRADAHAVRVPAHARFAWTWRGAPTEVTVKVAPDGEGARRREARVRAAVPRAIRARTRAPLRARTGSSRRSGTSRSQPRLLRVRGRALLLPDYAATGEALELSLAIEAPGAVFGALTRPTQLDLWIAEQAHVSCARTAPTATVGRPRRAARPDADRRRRSRRTARARLAGRRADDAGALELEESEPITAVA